MTAVGLEQDPTHLDPSAVILEYVLADPHVRIAWSFQERMARIRDAAR